MFSKTAVFALTLAMALPNGAAPELVPPPVPANLEIPEGHAPFLISRAEGTQNYICLATNSGFTWTFLGPQATLFDSLNEQVVTHYLSANPAENDSLRATWQHSADTSTVWAAATASSTDPNYVAPGAISWLRLQVVGAQPGPTGGATLTNATFIQRVNTSGGLAPASGCKSAKDIGKKSFVPYATDYVFYTFAD